MIRRLVPALLVALPIAAHNYPLTHGTLQAAPGGLRLTLRLTLHHFHPALEAHLRRHVLVKDGATYEAADLASYFNGRLELLDGDTVIPFEVVSQTMELKDVVVVLEAPTDHPERLKLRHTVMFEVSPKQKNLITVEGLGTRRGLVFEAKTPLLPLVP
jgi:hypothetical protein